MFNSTANRPSVLTAAVAISFTAAMAFAPLAFAAEEKAKDSDAAASKEVTGEVVDMMCYMDHGAKGEKHAACAAKCIKSGGPVGIVSEGKTYLIVGDHKPMNDQLAEHAGKTITVKGKMAEKDGISMIENAEIVKK
jgi:membrane-bound ClpP family serine protease